MTQELITLAHGNGGRLMNALIKKIIAPAFNMNTLDTTRDAAPINCVSAMMVTTDGYTVDPLFFPGGNIGKLAVCGTLNDLLVSGAIPQYLTVNLFIEEGFPIRDLTSIVRSMGQISKDNNVSIVAGDTKVLPKDHVSGIQISTTGIGQIINHELSMNKIKAGDKLFVTGSIGDHGAAVMLARESYGLKGNILSDCQVVNPVAERLAKLDKIKFMRDPTRGGLATVCHEISHQTGFGIQLEEKCIPIKESVSTFCELLGFNPLFLACEGRIIFVCSPEFDEVVLSDISQSVTQIGVITDKHEDVVLKTYLGGINVIPELENEALPRIC